MGESGQCNKVHVFSAEVSSVLFVMLCFVDVQPPAVFLVGPYVGEESWHPEHSCSQRRPTKGPRHIYSYWGRICLCPWLGQAHTKGIWRLLWNWSCWISWGAPRPHCWWWGRDEGKLLEGYSLLEAKGGIVHSLQICLSVPHSLLEDLHHGLLVGMLLPPEFSWSVGNNLCFICRQISIMNACPGPSTTNCCTCMCIILCHLVGHCQHMFWLLSIASFWSVFG